MVHLHLEYSGIPIEWKSPMCACGGAFVTGRDKAHIKPCSWEHTAWSLVIGVRGLRESLSTVTKLLNRGIPRSFEHIVERYGKGNGVFDPHGKVPEHIDLDPTGVDAPMGLFLHESLGITALSSSEPERFRKLLAGKSAQGLSETMWKEDYFHPCEVGRLFLPEEYVTSGDIDLKAAEAMFGRKMETGLLWVTGWEE